jgi:hypothetical protein
LGQSWDDEDYHLGTSEDDEPQLHYPFGKDDEVYIEALKAAQQEGGAVADYTSKLFGRHRGHEKAELEEHPAPAWP